MISIIANAVIVSALIGVGLLAVVTGLFDLVRSFLFILPDPFSGILYTFLAIWSLIIMIKAGVFKK